MDKSRQIIVLSHGLYFVALHDRSPKSRLIFIKPVVFWALPGHPMVFWRIKFVLLTISFLVSVLKMVVLHGVAFTFSLIRVNVNWRYVIIWQKVWRYAAASYTMIFKNIYFYLFRFRFRNF